VGIDNVAAARTVVRHLLSQGYRRISPLGVNDSDTAVLRLRGFRQELEAWDIRPAESLELATRDWSPQGGYEAVGRLLSADRRTLPQAVFAFNDSLAIGALRVLRENGIDVPGQVAVAGIDDLVQSAFVDPPLTSLAPDLDEIADSALSALTLQIDGKSWRNEYRRKLTSFELKVRESTVRSGVDSVKKLSALEGLDA
jgi:DNA-binding LacI/PurR family transcriptional regulator